jgi:hypothetical protein
VHCSSTTAIGAAFFCYAQLEKTFIGVEDTMYFQGF